MPAMLRSLSTSRERGKCFLSRIGHCHSLLRRRLSAIETRVIRPRPRTRANKRPRRLRQHKWSLQSAWSMTTCSPYLIKKDDPGVPIIICSINRCYFYNTVCDTRLGVNIMAKVGPYLCAAAVGRGVLLLCGWDSEKCPYPD